MLGTELHKIANRRCYAGTHHVDGRHDVTGENRRGGWRDKAIVGLEKKVVLEMLSRELGQMTNDRAICSKKLDATAKNDFENTIEVFLKGTERVVEAGDQSDREGVYLESISAR